MLIIAGYPYVRENYLRLWDYFEGEKYVIVPKKWKVKKGKVEYVAPKREYIRTTKTYFHHSDYFLIGGTMKGFMPWLPFVVRRLWKNEKYPNRANGRKRHGFDGTSRVLFSASEPILLSTLYNSITAKLFGARHYIFTWENIPYDDKLKGFKGFLQKIILRFNLFLCDGLVCGNHKSEVIHRKYTKKPILVVPISGLDEKRFIKRDIPKRIDDIDLSGKFVITFAGAIDKRKGLQYLIPAFKQLREKNIDAKLVLIGSGTYENEIKQLILGLDLQDHVIQKPWIEHEKLLDIYSVSDVFVYPSITTDGWEEQFGYSMAEASLMELPVVATHTGSIDEVVKDGETGILVEQKNVSELFVALNHLYKNIEVRKKFGKDGREYIVKNYSHELIAQKYFDFFEMNKK